MSIFKFKIYFSAKREFVLNPPIPVNATPEGAVIAAGLASGIPLRRIKGGWVEYDKKLGQWSVFKVNSR